MIASTLGALLAVMLACAGESTPVPAATPEPTPAMEAPPKTPVSRSLTSATAMDAAIDTFIADPTPATLEGAKRAWLIAGDDYGPTEAFRFYDGPSITKRTGQRV